MIFSLLSVRGVRLSTRSLSESHTILFFSYFLFSLWVSTGGEGIGVGVVDVVLCCSVVILGSLRDAVDDDEVGTTGVFDEWGISMKLCALKTQISDGDRMMIDKQW